MLVKRRILGNGHVRVTFILLEPGVENVDLLGDFTGWRPDRAMRRTRGGSWRVTYDLERGKEFQYRYLVDGGRWVNDPTADRYVPNPFGSDNSVVVTA